MIYKRAQWSAKDLCYAILWLCYKGFVRNKLNALAVLTEHINIELIKRNKSIQIKYSTHYTTGMPSSSSSSSSSSSRSQRGPSRHCTTCPQSTARLQRSPVGRVESFHSWSSHLFRGRPGGQRHVRSGGWLSDTLTWSWRAMFAGVTSSSRATCPNTEMRRQDRRWDNEVRPHATQQLNWLLSLVICGRRLSVSRVMWPDNRLFDHSSPWQLIQLPVTLKCHLIKWKWH